MSKLKRPSSNNAYIELRSHMKGQFLEALQQQPAIEGWPDAQLVIFGSTLMRQFSKEYGYEFPFSGRKSSDIDIGVHTPDPRKDFTDKYIEKVSPILKKTVEDCGFDLTCLEKGYSGKREEISFPASQVSNIEGAYFADDFIVSHTFSEAEAKAILDKSHLETGIDYAPYLEKLKDANGRIKIDLIISSTPVPTPTLLNPKSFDPDPVTNGHIQLKRDDRLNMMAAKIARNFIPSTFKPTDFIDIYNLLHVKSEKPLFNFDRTSPDHQLDDLRTLIVAKLPVFDFRNPLEIKQVYDNFDASDVGVERFKKHIDETVGKYGDLTDDHIRTIIVDCRKFVESVMSPRVGEKCHGPLNLTERDANFIAHVEGIEVLPGFAGIRGMRDTDGDPATPFIDTKLLKEQYPQTFARYPELEKNLQTNYYMNDRIDHIVEQRQNALGG